MKTAVRKVHSQNGVVPVVKLKPVVIPVLLHFETICKRGLKLRSWQKVIGLISDILTDMGIRTKMCKWTISVPALIGRVVWSTPIKEA